MRKPRSAIDCRLGLGENVVTHVLRGLPSSLRIALAGTAPPARALLCAGVPAAIRGSGPPQGGPLLATLGPILEAIRAKNGP